MLRVRTALTTTLTSAILAGTLWLAGCGDNSGRTRVVSQDNSITTRRLDVQDFRSAARDITNQMISAPRVQQTLAQMQRNLPEGQYPLLKISRIRNDTGLKINLVDYLVTPIDATLINSGKVDTYSEDRIAQGTASAKDLLYGQSTARLPDLVMYGVVSRLSGHGDGVEQNAYTFHVRLSNANTGTDIFVGDKEIIKQTNR